jgi:hypothetical protein
MRRDGREHIEVISCRRCRGDERVSKAREKTAVKAQQTWWVENQKRKAREALREGVINREQFRVWTDRARRAAESRASDPLLLIKRKAA